MLPHTDPIDESLPPDLYTIRLQGPWQFAWVQPPGGSPASLRGTVRLPAPSEELIGGRSGTLRLTRKFQRPTNLDREERVLLLLPTGTSPATARLNGEPIDFPKLIETRPAADLTGILRPSNELELIFIVDAGGPTVVAALAKPILIGIMPDFDGTWWESLPARQSL